MYACLCGGNDVFPPPQLELGKLFRDLPVSEAQEMSLSLMHEKQFLSPTDGLLARLDPMHIHTYRLSW